MSTRHCSVEFELLKNLHDPPKTFSHVHVVPLTCRAKTAAIHDNGAWNCQLQHNILPIDGVAYENNRHNSEDP